MEPGLPTLNFPLLVLFPIVKVIREKIPAAPLWTLIPITKAIWEKNTALPINQTTKAFEATDSTAYQDISLKTGTVHPSSFDYLH